MKATITAITIIVAALLLTSCGSNDNNGGYVSEDLVENDIPPPPLSTPPPPTVSETYEVDTPTPAPPPATRYIPTHGVLHQPVDLGGRTIRLATFFEDTLFGFGDEPDPATAANYTAQRMMWDNAQRVQHSFNVEFELVYIQMEFDHEVVLNELRTSVAAGAPVGDVAHLVGFNKIHAISEDILIPLDSIDLPGSDILGYQLFAETVAELFGERWSFSRRAPDLNAVMLGVNLDIINSIGAPNPVELYNHGEWNWQNFLDIMRLATASDPVLFGICTRAGIMGSEISRMLIVANDGRMVSDDFEWDLLHPNTLEALEFAELLFNEGLVSRAWNNGHARANAPFFAATANSIAFANIPYEHALLPMPTGPSNTSGTVSAGGWEFGYVLPQGSAWDSAELLMIMEELFAWPGDIVLLEDFQFGWFSEYFPADDLERALAAGRNSVFCVSLAIDGLFFSFSDYFEVELQRGNMTLLEIIEHFRAPYQAILDEFFLP